MKEVLFSVSALSPSSSHLHADHSTYTTAERTADPSAALYWQGRKLNCCTSRRAAELVYPTVMAPALNSVAVPSFHCCTPCFPLCSRVWWRGPGEKTSHVSCDPSEQESTTWILASWTQKELSWSFRCFQGLLALSCSGSSWVFPEDTPEAIFW